MEYNSNNQHSSNDSKEVSIIHTLVLKRFDNAINNYLQRKLKRQRIRLENRKYSDSEEFTNMPEETTPNVIQCDAVPRSDYAVIHKQPSNDLETIFAISQSNNSKVKTDSGGNSSKMGTYKHLVSGWRKRKSRQERVTSLQESLECLEYLSSNTNMDELNRQFVKFNQIIYQASKYLKIAKNSKEFIGSAGHVDAERILLETEIKKRVLQTNINRNDYEDINNTVNHGTVQLKNLKFSQITLDGHAQISKDFTQHFLCVLCCDQTILSTEVVTSNIARQITFQKTFEFKDLYPDFRIDLCLYSLRLPTKIFKRSKNKILKYIAAPTNHKSSQFSPIAHSNITCAHLKNPPVFNLFNTDPSAEVCETFTADLIVFVTVTNNMRGFLTIGHGGNLAWSRRWCCLDGATLKYWNYPSEEDMNRIPVGVIDLRYCLTNNITSVDRTLCSRPRTFSLEIQKNDSSESTTIVQYFLSADNLQEMNEWKLQLNDIVESLRIWSGMKCQLVFSHK